MVQKIYPSFNEADMIVFASLIYAIQRTYAPDKSKNCRMPALILNSIGAYQNSIVEYWNLKNAGVFTAWEGKGRTKEKYQELYHFGNTLQTG